MSVLQDPQTTAIDFSEEGCSFAQNRPGLYQAVGASLDGGDYLIANSTFVSDQGSGYEISYEYPFGASSTVTLTPVINNGATYQNLAPSQLPIPFMGDASLSPSGKILVSRLNGIDQFGYAKPLGYKFHKIHKNKTSTGYHYELQEIGSLCMPGQKATVSFDERMVVTYGYEDGHSNLYLADLATGKWVTIVRTQADQFALFPHFRSDGWIYFLLYDRNSRQRYLIASDAAIKLANSVR
jgi:hypothetical protein